VRERGAGESGEVSEWRALPRLRGSGRRGRFFGAKLKKWLPHEKPLSGKVAEAIEYIQNHFRNWWNKPLPFSELQKAIGMSYRQNFNQDIRRHPDFREALIGMQVSEFSHNKSKRLTHFRLWE
jgi:hypothetical protein